MKKLLAILFSALLIGTATLSLTACTSNDDSIIVDTNAFFAPFEYYDDTDIVGVDVDIMNLVGEKLGKKVVFENTDFDIIIDNVASGKQYDCGAAGITITDERKALVDFSNTYFTSVQYVIAKAGELTAAGTTDDGVEYVLWSGLKGKKVGVQRNTTGDIYVSDEIGGGCLQGSGAECTGYDDVYVAVNDLGINLDYVVVDKLPAEYIVNKNSGTYVCYALYYDAEEGGQPTATEEQYAICVTKGNTELLNAINEVLAELGEDGINKLVEKHLGLTD